MHSLRHEVWVNYKHIARIFVVSGNKIKGVLTLVGTKKKIADVKKLDLIVQSFWTGLSLFTFLLLLPSHIFWTAVILSCIKAMFAWDSVSQPGGRGPPRGAFQIVKGGVGWSEFNWESLEPSLTQGAITTSSNCPAARPFKFDNLIICNTMPGQFVL